MSGEPGIKGITLLGLLWKVTLPNFYWVIRNCVKSCNALSLSTFYWQMADHIVASSSCQLVLNSGTAPVLPLRHGRGLGFMFIFFRRYYKNDE